MMRFYQQQHRFYCGIDLYSRSMYLCILDQVGGIVLHQNVAAECMFAWYWLADLCRAEGWLTL